MLQKLSSLAFILTLFSVTRDSESYSIIKGKTQPSFATENQNLPRRTLFQDLSKVTLTAVGLFGIQQSPANASGGATAGGAYLLSAKQRYNQRVTNGVKAFLALSTSLESGSLVETKAFFENEEEGGWKDASAAGYLLSNAFRRSSTTPPDSLPSVKKWKAFAAELDNLQKSLKKKDVKGVNASYAKAEVLLDAYLDAVELPPVIEMKK